MSSPDSERDPERLLDGKYGSLLREANREWAAGLDEPAAFRRVAERLAASRHDRAFARARWLVAAAALTLGGFVGLALTRPTSPELAPELVAEPTRPALARSAPSSPATAVASQVSEAAPARVERRGEPRVTKSSVPSVAPSPLPRPLRAEPAPPPEAPVVPGNATEVAPEPAPAPAPDCLSLARHGQARAAETCFSARAEGGGLAAEMALYELSRLRRDVLSDPQGALRALADYRARFPSGSLRREVDVSQLELLLQLGRSDDALQRSDELLSSSATGERAGELRMLRGHILRKQSRFAEAAREYELAERAGARGGESTYFRAICLEAAGRPAEAAAALTQYLELPQRPYAADARRRLEKLKP